MALDEIQDLLAEVDTNVYDFEGTPREGFGTLVTKFVPDITITDDEIQDTLDSEDYIYDAFMEVAPSIVTQPTDQTGVSGDTFAFDFTYSGTAPNILQWKQDTGSGFVDMVGENNTPLYVTTPPFGTEYKCSVTNAYGSIETDVVTTIELGKFILTFNDASTYAFPANGSTIITQAERNTALTSAGKSVNDITKIEVNEGITRIENHAFYLVSYCQYGLVLPSTLTSIGKQAFFKLGEYATAMPPVIFHPDSIVFFDRQIDGDGILSSDTFRYSGITGSQILPSGTSAVRLGFYQCDKITGFTFRDRTDDLRDRAFISLPLLTTITFEQNTVPAYVQNMGYYAWVGGTSSVKVYVPATGDSLATWKASLYDGSMGTQITHINDIAIGDI